MELLAEKIDALSGVGPKTAERLFRLGIRTVEDLLYHFPRDYEDRRNRKKIGELVAGERTSTVGTIFGEVKITRTRGKRPFLRVMLRDDTGRLFLTFFNMFYLKDSLTQDKRIWVNGDVKRGAHGLEMINPSLEFMEEAEEPPYGILPVYSTTDGLKQSHLIQLQEKALGRLRGIGEYLPEELLRANRLCGLEFALNNIHFPESAQALKIARYRLIFEEFFLLRLALLRIKEAYGENKVGYELVEQEGMKELLDLLPFRLTGAQLRAFEEIKGDLKGPTPMNRLVQGDVGAGKTIVAILALYLTVLNGHQSAMMAPTEILVEQHYESITELLAPLGIRVGCLTGSLKRKEKQQLLTEIEAGTVQVVVGTHAVIQDQVVFHSLALAITDEQHRFGVRQRAALAGKGKNAHVLVMTATPIPRTLALILYGDLDISIIDELPPQRKKIETKVFTQTKQEQVYDFVKDQLRQGRQAYVVCPLVEESDKIEAESAVEQAELLAGTVFSEFQVGLLHGRLSADEKDDLMQRFKAGEIHVLVSTTVIEVGVNVPNATVMVIQNAERFGLAQLHQLRGRVGRGAYQSYCLLVHCNISAVSKERMSMMVKSQDGFEISEKDLELRGTGEFFGTRQHGLPELKIANLFKHMAVLQKVEIQLGQWLGDSRQVNLEAYPLLKKKLAEKYQDILSM